ncbi:MAG: hypothetical protein IPI23_00920 [Bacteroidetes bacterium]|nr:hypothetical protein [Bacteroidota bacterium]
MHSGASGRYEDITETKGKSRCVTIDYEGEFHVDLVPAVIQEDGSLSICNKNTDKFETTDGEGYANWFEQCDLNANSNLVPVVRLIKFLRDDKVEFSTKSIILTTIAANQISTANGMAGNYIDLPNTLTAVLCKMNDYLSAYEKPPTIINPAMPGENFNRHWKNDQEGFDKFKTAIKSYFLIASKANQATDIEESLKLWKQLFGDKFSTESYNYLPLTNIRENKFAVPITPERPWAN